MNDSFTKAHTEAIKGVAIVLMLMHHLFYDQWHIQRFYLFFGTHEANFWVTLAYISKVCVAIFTILSGYGICKSYKDKNIGLTKFTMFNIKKIIIIYWWAIIPFMIWGGITGSRTLESVYGSGLNMCLKATADILGIGYILYGFSHMFNVTCWYISEILILYILFPILYKIISCESRVMICTAFLVIYKLSSCIPNFLNYYLACFFFGVILEKYLWLDIFIKYTDSAKSMIAFFVLLCVCIVLRMQIGMKADMFLALMIIGMSIAIFNCSSHFRKIASFIGRHSANIFLTHTFFYHYFFSKIIYVPRIPVFVLIFLLIVCLAYSKILECILKEFRRTS